MQWPLGRSQGFGVYLDVSENSGIPKWMVKIMENPIKMDDLGGKPTIFGNIHLEKSKRSEPLEFQVMYHISIVCIPGTQRTDRFCFGRSGKIKTRPKLEPKQGSSKGSRDMYIYNYIYIIINTYIYTWKPEETSCKWMLGDFQEFAKTRDLVHHPIDSQPFTNRWKIRFLPGVCCIHLHIYTCQNMTPRRHFQVFHSNRVIVSPQNLKSQGRIWVYP